MNQSIPTHESQVTELKEQLANEKTNARSLDREKTYYYMKNIQLEAQLEKAEGHSVKLYKALVNYQDSFRKLMLDTTYGLVNTPFSHDFEAARILADEALSDTAGSEGQGMANADTSRK